MRDLNLIKTLLRICQSDEELFRPSASLNAFCVAYHIGQPVGARIAISENEKASIRALLLNEDGVPPDTPPDAWDGLSRSEALALGSNEKHTRKRVRDEHVAIKALPGRNLRLGVYKPSLPPGACIDIDWNWVVLHNQHEQLLVVENWECFENLHRIDGIEDFEGLADNPLVLYRGDLVYGTGHANQLISALNLPVLALVDYDPQGLLIANSLPRLDRFLSPPEAKLRELLSACTNTARYLTQYGKNTRAIESLTHPELVKMRALLKEYGVALPQESLIQ